MHKRFSNRLLDLPLPDPFAWPSRTGGCMDSLGCRNNGNYEQLSYTGNLRQVLVGLSSRNGLDITGYNLERERFWFWFWCLREWCSLWVLLCFQWITKHIWEPTLLKMSISLSKICGEILSVITGRSSVTDYLAGSVGLGKRILYTFHTRHSIYRYWP